jgi:hypothetical protein
MRLRLLAAAAVMLSASVAFADEFVTIGKLKVRADSPLAKGEHPRLLITRDQLPAIRARLKNPEIAKYVEQAREIAKLGKADALLLAVLYQVTGEAQYADMAKAKLRRPDWDPTWAFAFDLVAETMTEDERRAQADAILATVQKEIWRPRILLVLAAWGHGKDAELTPFLERTHAEEIVRTLAQNNRWTQGRGGSSMGHGYNGEHFYSCEFAGAVGWSRATGEDVISKSDFADQMPAWYIYHYQFWTRPLSVIRIGVTSEPTHEEAVMPRKFEGENLVMLAITRTKNGLGQWWQREVMADFPLPPWRKDDRHLHGLWGRILWLDPDVPSVAPEKLPPTRLFPENGHVVMRSSWAEDATVALFRCGRMGEIDGYWGRNNADNLHFIIEKKGFIAPDTGCAHNVNEAVCQMIQNLNLYDYGRQTIAHNSITVGHEDHRVIPNGPTPVGTIRRGGQTPFAEKDWLAKWGLKPAQGDRLKQGDITAYETSPDFDYACGDATHSYPPQWVKGITRQFVYLKPDTFVVFDRVRPADPKLDVIWNLHALAEPKWNGKSEADPDWPAEKQFIIAPGREKVANPHPGGHFLLTGGDTFTVEDGGGMMEVKTLLPEADARVVRTIGGPWHDFEIEGVNYGPTDATYARPRRETTNSIAVGGWRIEVSPKAGAEEVEFLHVLHVGELGKLEPMQATLLRQGGRVGASVKVADAAFEVLFDTKGDTGGHVKITRKGNVAADEELARKIEDNYDRWRSDPRWQTWMTDPYMRTVVFPYGRKPQ